MTERIFLKHSGNWLKKWIGLVHDKIQFDNRYTYIQVPGKVVWREEPEEGTLMVLRSSEPLELKCRAMVETNPDLGKFGLVTSQFLLEPGDIPTVYFRGYHGYYEELELEWLFRIYFIQ